MNPSNCSFMRSMIVLCIALFLSPVLIAQEEGGKQGKEEEKEEKKGFINKLFERTDTANQIPKNLYLWGRVYENEKPLAGATVKVVREGITRETPQTDQQGYFDVYLDFGFLYDIQFMKPGYVTKHLEVDTRDIPVSDRQYGYETGDFEVSLFPKVEGFDFSIYEQPVGKIMYSFNTQQFVYDRRYIAKMKKKTDPIEEDIKDEMIEASEALAKQDERFKVLIRDGDIEFKANDLALAETYYKEALKIRPEAPYPTEQLKKIAAMRKLEQETQEAKLKRFIAKADSSFDAENYENAKLGYEAALDLAPSNNYARTRLAEAQKRYLKQQAQIAEKLKSEEKPDRIDISKIEINTDYIERSKEIARTYPQGITRDEYKEGNKVVTVIYVVEGSKGVEYKKVKHDWGGVYYFRNEESIPKFQYNKETLSSNQ